MHGTLTRNYNGPYRNYLYRKDFSTGAINALPASPERTQLLNALASFRVEARHTLRGCLPHLAVPERLLTTGELGRLGDAVPDLRSVEILLPLHPNEQATITITGTDIQPGVYLLVDGQLISTQSVTQHGASVSVFVANWTGDQHPQRLDLLNPDDTVAQAPTLLLKNPGGTGNGRNGKAGNPGGNGSSNGHRGGNGNGGGNGGGKPGSTPTPHQ